MKQFRSLEELGCALVPLAEVAIALGRSMLLCGGGLDLVVYRFIISP